MGVPGGLSGRHPGSQTTSPAKVGSAQLGSQSAIREDCSTQTFTFIHFSAGVLDIYPFEN